jgi:two-component system chemotaxis sensor kinase CheA
VIKSLEANYQKVEGVSGATILGDGLVSLIIDITGIIKLAGLKKAGSTEFSMQSLEKEEA